MTSEDYRFDLVSDAVGEDDYEERTARQAEARSHLPRRVPGQVRAPVDYTLDAIRGRAFTGTILHAIEDRAALIAELDRRSA